MFPISQAARQKRKRQERDALFKAQAQAKALKRAGDEHPEASALPRKSNGQAGPRRSEDGSRVRARRRPAGVPALLPAELLESDSEDEEEKEQALLREAKRPKKITFGAAERQLDRAARPPAEKRVGSTVYRPLTVNKDTHLAPKARKHSMARKRELLNRGRTQVQQRGGFFVAKR